MKILYFTEGKSLESRELREQLARIPEVLSEIKKIKGAKLQPLLSFLDCDSNYQPWVRVVQRGLLARLRKTGFKYSSLMRRELVGEEKLESQLVKLMSSRSQIEFHVIGPGYDNLHLLIKKIQSEYQLDCEVIFNDVIGSDPRLTWFWAEVRKSDGRKNRDNSSVDASYH